MTASTLDAAATHDTWRRATILLALVLGTWLVFDQTLSHDFVNYDDPGYVYQDDTVSHGLSAAGLKAAFLQPHARNWHPLTTISHMIDCQLFGLEPAGHHLTSVLLHIAAALLLFEVLRFATGALWRAAFVAGLFAIHPLRVESVAWIAERKDVLSAFLFMLAMGAYIAYARRPSVRRYLVSCILVALGLMAKPMLVTLPLLFLLLDYWPLGRFGQATDGAGPSRSRLLIEKIPMLALAFGSAVATLIAQRYTVGYSATTIPFYWRAGNSLSSVFIYIGQMFWPTRLAVFYPYPSHPLSPWWFTGLAGGLIGLTSLAFVLRRSRPWIMVGWSWYLISLLPVIGLVQVGLQGHADRYTYLPQIGLYLIIAWEAGSIVRSHPAVRFVLAPACLLILGGLARLAWRQTATWKNTETLWTQAATVNPANVVAQYSVGSIRMEKGDFAGAISHFRMALQFASLDAVEVGQPNVGYLHNSLGNALLAKGDTDEAAQEYLRAIAIKPDFADAHSNLAAIFVRQNNFECAIKEYEVAVAIPPEDAQSHLSLARLLQRKGEDRFALAHLERAVALEPAFVPGLEALASALVTSPEPTLRDPKRGLELAERAAQLTRRPNPAALRIAAVARAMLTQ